MTSTAIAHTRPVTPIDAAPPAAPHRAASPALPRVAQLLDQAHTGQHYPAVAALLEPHLVGVRALPEVETVIPASVVVRLLAVLPSSLVLAIVQAVRPWLPTAAVAPPAEPEPGPQVELSQREGELLVRLARGLSNGEIGRQLWISEDTVKTHARRLYRKLGARDRAHAVALGYQLGVLR